MANTTYTVLTTYEEGSNYYGSPQTKTTTAITIKCYKQNGMSWLVEGMAAS